MIGIAVNFTKTRFFVRSIAPRNSTTKIILRKVNKALKITTKSV